MLDHDVLGLYIAVDYALVVHVLQRSDDLLAVVGRLLLPQPHLPAQVPEQALRAVLQNEVNVLAVVEHAVQFEHVGMVHEDLQLYLPEHLVHHVGLLYL